MGPCLLDLALRALQGLPEAVDCSEGSCPPLAHSSSQGQSDRLLGGVDKLPASQGRGRQQSRGGHGAPGRHAGKRGEAGGATAGRVFCGPRRGRRPTQAARSPGANAPRRGGPQRRRAGGRQGRERPGTQHGQRPRGRAPQKQDDKPAPRDRQNGRKNALTRSNKCAILRGRPFKISLFKSTKPSRVQLPGGLCAYVGRQFSGRALFVLIP